MTPLHAPADLDDLLRRLDGYSQPGHMQNNKTPIKQAMKRAAELLRSAYDVPVDAPTDEAIVELAHRTASTYRHRSDPEDVSFGFMRHTLLDFARKLLTLRDGVKAWREPISQDPATQAQAAAVMLARGVQATVEPSNEELENLWETTHYGHPADFAADVLERWGGWPSGLLGRGGALEEALKVLAARGVPGLVEAPVEPDYPQRWKFPGVPVEPQPDGVNPSSPDQPKGGA